MAANRSIALRLIAAAVLWLAAALIAGGFLLSHLFREPVEKAFEQRLEFFLENLIAASDISPTGQIAPLRPLGEPRFLNQYSGLYWQIGRADTDAVIFRSRSMWDFEFPVNKPATKAARRFYDMEGPIAQRLRVVEQFLTEDGVPGRYVFTVASDTAEVVLAVDTFNRTLMWSLGGLGIGLLIAIIVQVYYGLLPLQRIRKALLAIREGRSERLTGDFPSEVKPLADELNGLLDHTSEVLGRARAHVGNLAHALKTPIAVLANEGDNPSPGTPEVLRKQIGVMRRQVEQYLSRARAVGQAPLLRSHTRVLPVARAVARTLERIYETKAVCVSVAGEPQMGFRGEQQDLEEMLGNLVDNGCKWAAAEVSITVEGAPATVGSGLALRIDVDDDGPGVPAAKREEVLRRGGRLDEETVGDGLGLSIVSDFASLYGGRIALADAPKGGLRVSLWLPGILMPEENDGTAADG